MQSATQRFQLITLSVVFFALVMVVAVRESAAQSSTPPLEVDQIIALLQRGIPASRVAELIDERGINFDITARIEERIRGAGGGESVVDALRRASQRRGSTDQPSTDQSGTGSVVIKTTPGEAQIYLNDEPKGMSSPEGDLKLPALKTGTYNLRVSMPGYQSYEKPLTIVSGEENRVYVTLNLRSGDQTTQVQQPEPQGLPIPGIKPPQVQFYEGDFNSGVERGSRVYRFSFDRSRARAIYWELDLTFPAPGKRIDFPVDAVWYGTDGTEINRQHLAGYVNPAWGTSWHTMGIGWADAGHWAPGTYRVDFLYRNNRVASGTFQID